MSSDRATFVANPQRRNAIQKVAKFSMLAGALAAFGLMASGCDTAKPSFHSVDITGADYAQGFNLPDQNGKLRTLAEFKGKVVAVFFGYTQCPDVCPTTLTEMVEVKKRLGVQGDKLQVVFVSVDPARDTAELLKAYMASFDPSFIALSATPEQLTALAKDFKVYYKKVEGKTPTSYTMDHSAGTYLFDPQGKIRLFSRYGAGVEALAGDIQQLLGGR